ncbi:HamA C-terminal domain-containing protein [Kaistia sp. MMO-174]|uniref:HamA C-terminal domain-containing protein n=1 Tax=Kaistia sp. MMO-174 TaxID=3081256 RepID=UPI0030182CEF
MSVYDQKPDRFLAKLQVSLGEGTEAYCAGFEMNEWRCSPFAFHLAEWLPEYALPEEELRIHHENLLMKLHQAAIRVYTSEKYKNRGEAGEIALHAICRDYFGTIPLSPRVFYKSSSNDVVKAFDMVHVRLIDNQKPEIWLGESKLYETASKAVSDAIASVSQHLDAGFLTNQKVLLGPQIPKSTPRYEEIVALFNKNSSLDELIGNAVFVIGISCDSLAALEAQTTDNAYLQKIRSELEYLWSRINNSGLNQRVRIRLIYTPLANKNSLVEAFDRRLKGLQ